MSAHYYIKRVAVNGAVAWTGPIISSLRAENEARAWRTAGWSAVKAIATPEVKREVRAWQATTPAHRHHI